MPSMPLVHRWRSLCALPALCAALLLGGCQTIPDVSGWNQATQALAGSVVGGFEAAAAVHQDIGQRLDSQSGFKEQAKGYQDAAAALTRGGEAYGLLFAAMADYSASLAAVSKASANSSATVDAVAGSVNQLLGAVGVAGLAGAGFELGKLVASEAIKIKAARDFAEAVDRADPTVARVADLLVSDLDDLAKTLSGTKREPIMAAYNLAERDRLDYRRALVARLAVLQADVGSQVQPAALPGAPRPTAALAEKGPAEELQRVERLLQAADSWYLPLQAAIDRAQKSRAGTAALVAQARKAALAWKASHASLATAAREKRLPDTAHLLSVVTRLRELVADLKKEN